MTPELTCPFGAECEEIKDNQLRRCRLYINVRGMDSQTGEHVDRWDCALVWNVSVMIENTQVSRGTTQALESFRNEMQRGQAAFNNILAEALGERKVFKGTPAGSAALINGESETVEIERKALK